MAATCYLSEDIMFTILSWLPVKSLIRFSSVCKSWQSTIWSSQFVQTHLNKSQKKQPSIVLNYSLCAHVVSIDTLEDYVKLPMPPKFNDFNRKICSCNGLVCLTGFDKDVEYIWNQSTRRFKTLPAPNNRSKYFEPGVGFGFDPISSDYKILWIVFNGELCKNVTKVELYSANDDSWKDVEVPTLLERFIPSRSSKCVYTNNGVVFVQGYQGVLSFDLQNEQFELYPYPVYTTKMPMIFDIEGSVAIIFKSTWNKGTVYSLWMLDDVCGKLSWTKKFNLDWIHERDYNAECLYLGVGQYVVLNNDGYIYYDYGSGEKEIKKLDPSRKYTSIINYTESLVSLKGFEKQE